MGNLLLWVFIFAIVALICGVLGFGAIAGPGALAAQVMFWVALLFIALSLVGAAVKRAG